MASAKPIAKHRGVVGRALRCLLLATLLLIALVMLLVLASLLFDGHGFLKRLNTLVSTHTKGLLVYRLALYGLVTVVGPWLCFMSVKDPVTRWQLRRQFMVIFAVMFIFGEVFIVQNIIGTVF